MERALSYVGSSVPSVSASSFGDPDVPAGKHVASLVAAIDELSYREKKAAYEAGVVADLSLAASKLLGLDMAMDAMPLSDIASRAVAKAGKLAAAAEALAVEARDKTDTLFKLSAVDAIDLPYRDLSASVVSAAELLAKLYPEEQEESSDGDDGEELSSIERLPAASYGDNMAG